MTIHTTSTLSSAALAIAAAAFLSACATERLPHNSPEKMKHALSVFKRDFQAKGIASADRVNTDKLQDVCNRTSSNPSPEAAAALESEQAATVRLPADGKYLGDWKAGEKLAQSGVGMTWSDKEGGPIGGNCYNCHQISPKELSFGTIGPSLAGYAKIRGNSPEIQRYTYSKIFNAKAFNACSAMPRFGHVGALKEQQIKDLVALLLDPTSPVNK